MKFSWNCSNFCQLFAGIMKACTTARFSLKKCVVRWSSHLSQQPRAFDSYCFETVKNHDYENYLGGMLVPTEQRAAFYAIHAFNTEIATIADQIPRNQSQAGRIRFQFWKGS